MARRSCRYGDGVAARERASIRPIGRERIETIDHGQDASAERDLIAREPVRIAGAIPVFMMVTHDGHHGIREVHAGEDIGADLRVFFHGGVFGIGEPARLVQDVLGNRKLAEVVQQARRFDGLKLPFIRASEGAGELQARRLDAPDVPMRHLIFRIDGMSEHFDGRPILPVRGVEVRHSIVDSSEPHAHRRVQHERHRREHQQRQHASGWSKQRQEQRSVAAGRVRQTEMEEVRSPGGENGLIALECDRERHDPGVHEKVRAHCCGGRHGQPPRIDEKTSGALTAFKGDEDRARNPHGQTHPSDIEEEASGTTMLTRQEARDCERLERCGNRGRARSEQKQGRKGERVGNRKADRCRAQLQRRDRSDERQRAQHDPAGIERLPADVSRRGCQSQRTCGNDSPGIRCTNR